tara:strand:+ start:1765 stop:2682 length:918 start_codon:yes stop_codon:yes gene_type:complete
MSEQLDITFKNNKFIINDLNSKLTNESFLDFSLNHLEQYIIDNTNNNNNNNINFKFKNNSIDYKVIKKLLEITVNYKSKNILKSNFILGFIFGIYHISNLLRIINIKSNTRDKIQFKNNSKKYNVIKSNNCSRNILIYHELFNEILCKAKKEKITVALKVPFEKDESNLNNGYVIIDFYKGMSISQLQLVLIHNIYQIYVTNLIINLYYNLYNNFIYLINYFGINEINGLDVITINFFNRFENHFLKKIDLICEVFNNDSRNNSEIYINYENKFSNYNSNTLFASIYIKLMGDRKRAKGYVSLNY